MGGFQFNLPPTLFVNPTPKSSSDHLLILPATQPRHVSKCAAVIEKVNYLKNCVCFYLYLVDIVEAVIMDTPLSCQLYLWLISVAEFFFFSHTCRLHFKTPLEFYAYTWKLYQLYQTSFLLSQYFFFLKLGKHPWISGHLSLSTPDWGRVRYKKVVIIGCFECQLTSTFSRHFPDYSCHWTPNFNDRN